MARLAVLVKGALFVRPRSVTPSKSARFVTVPSESLAVAMMGTLAGEVKDAPFVGEVMATVGGTFAALTVTFTTVDVVERPPLSVATAVSAWAPTARLTVLV